MQLVKEHPELASLSFDFRDPHVVEDSLGHKTIHDAEDIKGGTFYFRSVNALFITQRLHGIHTTRTKRRNITCRAADGREAERR